MIISTFSPTFVKLTSEIKDRVEQFNREVLLEIDWCQRYMVPYITCYVYATKSRNFANAKYVGYSKSLDIKKYKEMSKSRDKTDGRDGKKVVEDITGDEFQDIKHLAKQHPTIEKDFEDWYTQNFHKSSAQAATRMSKARFIAI